MRVTTCTFRQILAVVESERMEWDGFASLMNKTRSSQEATVTKLEDHLGGLDVEGEVVLKWSYNKTGSVTHKVILRRVRATLVAVEKQ